MLKGLDRVLVVAPHADDESLGAGGLIARSIAEGRSVAVALMTGAGATPHPLFSAQDLGEVRREFDHAMGVLGVQKIFTPGLPSTLLSETAVHLINQAAQQIVADFRPDLVVLPFEHDLHHDHGILNYAFRVAMRSHLAANRRPHAVICYETPTETHLQHPHIRASFEPDLFVDISDHLDRKLSALACYASQMGAAPALRSVETSRVLAAWRGAQIGVGAAEAFSIVRAVA